MSSDNDKSNKELKKQADESGSGQQQGNQTGPVAGGADNTRGENKPSTEGHGGGAKPGKGKSGDKDHTNLTTTSRGADSTDKEFRTDQPNASTLKGHKSNVNLDKEKD